MKYIWGTGTLSRVVNFLVAVIIAVALPVVAAAKDLPISAFAGNWQGNAISENNVSVNFPITSRDIDVSISPADNGDFTVTWRTLLRQKGSPTNPKEVLKETTFTYVKSDVPNVWKNNLGGDVYAGDTVSWARISKQTLTVYVMAISDVGDYDMQVYKRTLTGPSMELEFTALRDGVIRRTAKGRLILQSK